MLAEPIKMATSNLDAVKAVKKKKKTVEKLSPILSSKFDEYATFDVFDFVQFRTQIKLVNKKSKGISYRDDLSDLVSVSKSKTKSKKTPKTPKSAEKEKSKSSKTSTKPASKKKITTDAVKEFKAKYPEIKSEKKIRAMLKTHEYIAEFLKKHPEIPVEKSHRKMGTTPSQGKSAPVEIEKKESATHQTPIKRKVDPAQRQEILPNEPVAKKLNMMQDIPNPVESLASNKLSESMETSKGQPVDHVAAINSWIQKNYNTLSTQQKQLVHMQLQYLNNLKKTSFHNTPFILSPQHLNNLNNLSFLHRHYNPFNRNYTNFLNAPAYTMDTNNKNMQMMQMQALKQQQSPTQPSTQGFGVQLPLSFTMNQTNGGSPQKNDSTPTSPTENSNQRQS